MMDLFFNLTFTFLGTVAFSILYSVPRRYYAWCGITGVVGWIVYLLLFENFQEATGIFFGTIVVVLMARVLAVYKKCPITIFLIPGIFPLIPGTSVYSTIYYMVTDQYNLAGAKGVIAIESAFAIVLGIVIMVSIPKEHFFWIKIKKNGEK